MNMGNDLNLKVSYYQKKGGLTYSYHGSYVSNTRWQTELWPFFCDDLGI